MTYWSSVQSSNSMPEYELIKVLVVFFKKIIFDVNFVLSGRERERESEQNVNTKHEYEVSLQLSTTNKWQTDKFTSAFFWLVGRIFISVSHSSFLYRLTDTKPLPCITMT